MLKKRLITVLFLLPPVIFLVWYNVLTTSLLAVLWGGLAAWEFYHNIGRDKATPLTGFGIILTALLIVHPVVNRSYYIPLLLTTSVILPLVWLLFQKFKENAFARWSWTIAGAIYVGWLLSYLLSIRAGYNLPQLSADAARNWTFYGLTVTIDPVSDSGGQLVVGKFVEFVNKSNDYELINSLKEADKTVKIYKRTKIIPDIEINSLLNEFRVLYPNSIFDQNNPNEYAQP